MLMNAAHVPPIILDFILPKFLRVTHRDSVVTVDNVLSAESGTYISVFIVVLSNAQGDLFF